ncbi:MAG TPA: NADH-quinone oxidoreductase subunit M [Dermatophilaceae bacterium]|nr:NADH-quinone oxidoreductase subunit M [Dermatophilaceae bacterium]
MSSFPWLTAIGLIPLVGALIVAFLPRSNTAARSVGLGFSLLTLLVALMAATAFDLDATSQFQFAETRQWIPQWGISYALGVDGMALAMIVMATILVPICLLAAWKDIPEGGRRQNSYIAWMLVLETLMIGVFAATDVFLFYVFFEAMLVPVYFLIGSYGGANRQRAAMKFLLFSLAGGLVMLVAVIGVYYQGDGGPQGFLVTNLTGLTMTPGVERLLFLGFFIAFAVKAPMWPVHTWLPDAAAEAKPATSVLLVGVLDKVGTYGMIRFCLQLFPDASRWATPVVIALALVSISYGAFLAIGQRDMMRLIAYTSVSHFGFIVLGIFAFTRMSNSGSVLYMVNHGFTTAALFLLAGMLVQRRGSTDIRDFGGWQRVAPVLAGTFLVSGMSGLALPGLGSFVSEFLVLMGTYQRYPIPAVIASACIVLAALYILLWYQRVFTGPAPGHRVAERAGGAVEYEVDPQPGAAAPEGSSLATGRAGASRGVGDLTGRERWVIAPLIALFVVLGFYPKVALDVINPSVDQTLRYVGVTDPAPGVGVAEGSAK